MVQEQDIQCQKNKKNLNTDFIPFMKNNSKMDYRLNVKCKTLKPPEDNNRKIQVILGRVMPF